MMVNFHEWELTEWAKKQGWEEGHTAGIIAGRLEGIETGKIEGEKYGAEQNKIETAKKLLLEGLSAEQIARCTNLSLEKVDGPMVHGTVDVYADVPGKNLEQTITIPDGAGYFTIGSNGDATNKITVKSITVK